MVAIASVSGHAENENIGVALIRTDGTQHKIEFASLKHIEIGTTTVTLHHATDAPVTHDMADIHRIDIGVDVSQSAIDKLTQEGSIAVWPTVTESAINISGAPQGAAVSVYSLDGRLITKTAAAEGTFAVDLSGADAGTYVVTVNNKSVKIIKK